MLPSEWDGRALGDQGAVADVQYIVTEALRTGAVVADPKHTGKPERRNALSFLNRQPLGQHGESESL